MTQLFISYSRDDELVMGTIRDNLRRLGFDLWIDSERLKPGTPEWEDAIENAIRQCDGMLVVCSPESKQSKWVRAETRVADNHQKLIIPILVKGDENDAIPIRLSDRQFCDMRGRAGPARGFRELVAFLVESYGVDVPDYDLKSSSIGEVPAVQVIQISGHVEGHVIAVGGSVSGSLNVAGRDVVHTPPQLKEEPPAPAAPSTPKAGKSGKKLAAKSEAAPTEQKARAVPRPPVRVIPRTGEIATRVYAGHVGRPNGVAWIGNEQIVAGGEGKRLIWWDAASGNKIRVSDKQTDEIYGIKLSPDGRYLVCGSTFSDQAGRGSREPLSFTVWDAHTGAKLHTVPVLSVDYFSTHGGVSAKWSPDSRWLAYSTSSSDSGYIGQVILWDATHWKYAAVINHTTRVSNFAWSPDGLTLAVGSSYSNSYRGKAVKPPIDVDVILYQVSSGKEIGRLKGHRTTSAFGDYTNTTYVVGSVPVSWSPDGRWLATYARSEESILIWDAKTYQQVRTMRPASCHTLVWSPDSQILASTPTMALWDVSSGKKLRGIQKGPHFVAWSPDGLRLAGGLHDRSVTVWDFSA